MGNHASAYINKEGDETTHTNTGATEKGRAVYLKGLTLSI